MKRILFINFCLCLCLLAEAQTSFERRVVVEELTGTRCGWCPRGLAGMMKLRQELGDKVIGIAVHNYDQNDPMYYRPYAYTGLFDGRGAPTCTVDRTYFCDPLHGSTGNIVDDVRLMLEQECFVGIEVSGSYNADSTVVDAQATINAGKATGQMQLVWVLVADSVYSTDTAFRQYNGYATAPADRYPDDPEVHIFCQGGAYGMSPFVWAYDDVCIGSSYNNSGANQAASVGPLAEGEQLSVSYRLMMPTKAVLKRVLNKRKVSVVAMLLDADGKVVNAAKQPLCSDVPQAIAPIVVKPESCPAQPAYDLQGRRVTTARNGIVISNGRKQLRR